MEYEFQVALDYCFALKDETHTIIFLVSDGGVRMPFLVSDDELSDLFTAIGEGEGAMPPLIASEVKEARSANLVATKVVVMDMDETEEEFDTWIYFEGEQTKFVKNCELLYGILFAIHAGLPIHVADAALARQARTEFCQNVFAAVEAFDEEGS